jgi:hypothetical protein
MHGNDDQIVPIEGSALLSARSAPERNSLHEQQTRQQPRMTSKLRECLMLAEIG